MTDLVDADFDVLIVGAGLTGLATAHLLCREGLAVQVLEARARTGGRIDSVFESGGSVADLGPTWVWPGFQPIIARWASALSLELYDQYEQGLTLVEAGTGQPVRRVTVPGQVGSKRIVGGPQALIDCLAQTLPKGAVKLGRAVREIRLLGHGVECTDELGRTIRAKRVIVTAPARIVVRDICFKPGLPAPIWRALSAIPTWMARHAKIVIRYNRPFWREQGLTGRILSDQGPLAEVHDHCGLAGESAALFGFTAWSPEQRSAQGGQFAQAVAAQLSRCFGPDAPGPKSITVKDWALDRLVATQTDLDEPMTHPVVQPSIMRQSQWERRLWFASAELAEQAPGLIAGALELAEGTAESVLLNEIHSIRPA